MNLPLSPSLFHVGFERSRVGSSLWAVVPASSTPVTFPRKPPRREGLCFCLSSRLLLTHLFSSCLSPPARSTLRALTEAADHSHPPQASSALRDDRLGGGGWGLSASPGKDLRQQSDSRKRLVTLLQSVRLLPSQQTGLVNSPSSSRIVESSSRSYRRRLGRAERTTFPSRGRLLLRRSLTVRL